VTAITGGNVDGSFAFRFPPAGFRTAEASFPAPAPWLTPVADDVTGAVASIGVPPFLAPFAFVFAASFWVVVGEGAPAFAAVVAPFVFAFAFTL
jgi:hypothetical protein